MNQAIITKITNNKTKVRTYNCGNAAAINFDPSYTEKENHIAAARLALASYLPKGYALVSAWLDADTMLEACHTPHIPEPTPAVRVIDTPQAQTT